MTVQESDLHAMTPQKKSTKLQRLPEETFGQKLHRAYRQSRATNGLVYREAAQAVSQFEQTTEQMLRRLELDLIDVPTRKRQLNVTFLALLAYGFDPAEFGIDEADVSLHPDVVKVARRVLPPTSRWMSRDETAHTPRVSRGPAGRSPGGASRIRTRRQLVA